MDRPNNWPHNSTNNRADLSDMGDPVNHNRLSYPKQIKMTSQDTLDRISALIPEGYRIAYDTLPEQVEQLVAANYAFLKEIEELRDRVSELKLKD